MIGFDDAVQLISGLARPLGTETVRLAEGHGRILAKPVSARLASPRSDVSGMDGYAVRDADITALPAPLRIIGEAFPGAGFAGPMERGAAVCIFTGAPLPAGADRVVIQEDVRREGDVVLIESAGAGRNIRAAGSDFREGEVLVEQGTLLGPRALVAAAAADIDAVEVYRRPRVRVLTTGDELAEAGTAHTLPGTIPDSVSTGLTALAREWGGEPVGHARLRDDLGWMRERAAAFLDGADLLVVAGGASVGERDFAKAMFGDRLELLFSKVAMKPGKPVWLGRAGEALVMGLPGNPTSALVTARLLLAPLLAGLIGRDPARALTWYWAPIAEALGPTGDRETFSRARWEGATVRLLPNQDSGAQKTLASAELLVRRRAGVGGYAAGELLDVLSF